MAYSRTTWANSPSTDSPLSAANLNNIEAGIVAEEAARIAADATLTSEMDAVSIASPSRALDTVYQNTSGKMVMVAITFGLTTTCQVDVYIGAASPPTTQVGGCSQTGATSVRSCVTFLVPTSYYYKATSAAGTPTKIYWVEWTLH